jgi:hypothetical protein
MELDNNLCFICNGTTINNNNNNNYVQCSWKDLRSMIFIGYSNLSLCILIHNNIVWIGKHLSAFYYVMYVSQISEIHPFIDY